MFAGMKKLFGKKAKEEKGASAVEYGMIIGLIAAVIVTVVALLGPQIEQGFQKTSDELTAQGLTGQ